MKIAALIHCLSLLLLLGCDDSAGDPTGRADASVGQSDGAIARSDAAVDAAVDPIVPAITECNDGIDNDGDGLVDWQHDLGCAGPDDTTEGASSREDELGWTTFDPAPNTRIFYVSSSDGDDSNDGTSPERAVATLQKGLSLLRNGQPDWLLLKRGDIWYENMEWGNRSGESRDARMIVASYGDSTERPMLKTGRQNGLRIGDASHIAFLDLDFYAHTRDPDSPEHEGSAGQAGFIRCCEYVENILIEGIRTRYYATNTLNTGNGNPENIELRRNVIVDNYPVFPDGAHSQGIYTNRVHGLLIEDNVFDLNGWNPDIEGAEATIFNHNMYLNGGTDLVLRGNLSLRTSSLGVKLNSNVTNGYIGLHLADNFIFDAEVGMSIGGNTDDPSRFVDVEVLNNVFLDMGRSLHTDRSLAWQLEVKDQRNTTVSGNHFIHQPWHSNAYGIGVTGDANENVTVTQNFFYNIRGSAFTVNVAAGWRDVSILENIVQVGGQEATVVRHRGPFDVVAYANNVYWSGAAPDAWFNVDSRGRSFDEWVSVSGESGARVENHTFRDPDRGLAEYQESLGREASIEGFLRDARQQSKFNWRPEYTAYVINEFFRDGFR